MIGDRPRPYRMMINRAPSRYAPDDWVEVVVDPGDVPEGYDPAVLRGVAYGLTASVVPWTLIWLLYRGIAG